MRKILLMLCTLCLSSTMLLAAPPSSSIIEEVLTALESYNPYKVEIEVIYAGNSILGFYEVDESKYYISIDQQELYGDANIKYEVFNSRKEVIIDSVAPGYSGNLLNNPATAFDSIRDHYTSEIISDNDGITTVYLKPNIGGEESIELLINNESMLPNSLIYRFGDDQVLIKILSITKLASTITLYDDSKYADFEIIDFR